MGQALARVWLTSDRYNRAFLFDIATGRAQSYVAPERVGAAAGTGQKVGRNFLAIYIDPTSHALILQLGKRKYPVDGRTLAVARVRYGGLQSVLRIEREDYLPVTLKEWTVARAFLRRIDPGYDDVDEVMDDFLRVVSEISASVERREVLSSVKNPAAGPWELLE